MKIKDEDLDLESQEDGRESEQEQLSMVLIDLLTHIGHFLQTPFGLQQVKAIQCD